MSNKERMQTIRTKLDKWATRFEAQPIPNEKYPHIKTDRDGNEVMNQGFVKIKLVKEEECGWEDKNGNPAIDRTTEYLYTTMKNVLSIEKQINRGSPLVSFEGWCRTREAGYAEDITRGVWDKTDENKYTEITNMVSTSFIKDITPVVQHLSGYQYGKFTTMKFSPRSQS